MNELTTVNNQALQRQAQNLKPGLFHDFVSWIDRSPKTTRSYLTNLKQFTTWLKYRGIIAPTRNDIIDYREWLSSEHEAIKDDPEAANGWSYRTDSTGSIVKITCKPNTVAQYLRSVSQFFRWTSSNGLYPDIASNIHAPKIRHGHHKKDALTVEDVLHIERSIEEQAALKTQEAQEATKDKEGRAQRSEEQGKRLYAMYLLAVNAGLRTIEISRADVKDLETKKGQTWLYVWGKGHAEADQKKALAPEVAQAVFDYLECRTDKPSGNSPLFVGTGNRSGGKRLATTTISTMLKKAMQDAGYNSDRLTAHSLRHTAGTAVQKLTGNLFTTQKYMRHADPKTTEIYIHEDHAEKEAATAKQLYDLYHGKEGDIKERLQLKLEGLTPQQLEQLESIAAAMTAK